MGHTNQTTNYGLTQFLGTDKPAWLVDYNGDMLKIDNAMKSISDVADAAKTKSDDNEIAISGITITANSAEAKASGAISSISDAYDSTSTYDVGDLVIYNNLLYTCITAISVPESFDGTHWRRTTIDAELESINNELSNITSWTQLTNEDLNNYKESAHLFATGTDTVTHKPGVPGFYNWMCEVVKIGTSARVKQTISSVNLEEVWYRFFDGTDWQAWHQM